MGGFVSYLVGEAGQDDEVSLLDLLENPDQDMDLVWTAMRQRLQSHPEEAAAYARSIDASPFQRALQLAHTRGSRMPVRLAQIFVESYEEAVFDTPASGETCLSVAVHGASFAAEDEDNSRRQVVKLLLECNPEAASQCTRDGLLPIHHVRSDLEIARVLLQAYPQGAATQDNNGRIPLHYCCSGNYVRQTTRQHDDGEEHHEGGGDNTHLMPTNPEVVIMLIEAAIQQNILKGGILMRDHKDMTPLDVICAEVSAMLNDKEGTKSDDLPALPLELWESLTVLLQYAAPQEYQKPFRVVHAAVASGCPPAVVAHAVMLHPRQARERDSRGRTPLMIAAMSMDRIHPSVACILLECHPGAACMTDAEGRLPIDVIAEAPQYDKALWEAIVKAEPRAVDTRDLRYKMFPFITAAMAKNSNVNTVYCLLRAKPHVLSYFLIKSEERVDG